MSRCGNSKIVVMEEKKKTAQVKYMAHRFVSDCRGLLFNTTVIIVVIILTCCVQSKKKKNESKEKSSEVEVGAIWKTRDAPVANTRIRILDGIRDVQEG